MDLATLTTLPISDYYKNVAWGRFMQTGLAKMLPAEQWGERIALYARLLKMDDTAKRREVNRRRQAKLENEGILYITLCETASAYGGPEEGGWYYDHSEPIASAPVLEGASHAYIQATMKRLVEMNREKLEELDAYQPYGGHGIGGCGDDDGMVRGEFSGDYGYSFRFTLGVPYEFEGRPQYC